MTSPEPKPRKPKFKYTRQLIRLAVDDGMTQKEIAAMCRVEQSVVSGWLNGKSLAFEHQVTELRRRYGRRLNRTTSRVYLVLREPAEPDRADHAPPTITLIEGPITLRHTFVRLETSRRGSEHEPVRVPIARWLVHHQAHRPPGRFVLVRQQRRMLSGLRRQRWEDELIRVKRGFSWHPLPDFPVECGDDAGRWLSFVEGPLDATALLEHCDRYVGDPSTLHDPHDELTLPFLVRKMLVELGYDVPDMDRISTED